MADAPQVVYESSDLEVEHPHAVYRSFEAPVSSPTRFPWPAKAAQGKIDNETALPASRILGLQRKQLWILCAIAVILIAGTIGGSIGGVLAVQSSRYGKPEGRSLSYH